MEDLTGFGTATEEMFAFLRACVEARLNLFLSGGTGSGKTTTLNVLSSFIPEDERIITIEDAAELQLSQAHVISLEARPSNLEGRGEITIRDLLRNALHMRPDRIVVGECRAGEALDMIQAMTTGQEGSLSTGHANTPRDMLRRLETMILMTGYELPLRAIREQIASAVDVIVHTARLRDGSRKIVSITEVLGTEDDDILTQEIFSFVQTAFRDGKVEGDLRPTGIRPTFMNAFKVRGISLPPGDFGIPPEDPNQPPARVGKSRWGSGLAPRPAEEASLLVGLGRAVVAGGMVYVSAVGPVDPETGRVMSGEIRAQARQCLANLRARLEEAGSSLDKVVWANWSLRDATRVRCLLRGVAALLPGRCPGRPGDAPAAGASPRRFPRLASGSSPRCSWLRCRSASARGYANARKRRHRSSRLAACVDLGLARCIVWRSRDMGDPGDPEVKRDVGLPPIAGDRHDGRATVRLAGRDRVPGSLPRPEWNGHSRAGHSALPDRQAIFAPTRPPIDLTVTLDPAAAASAVIPVEGGDIEATGEDGTVYQLSIPDDALIEATEIRMTPVASPGRPPDGRLGELRRSAGARWPPALRLRDAHHHALGRAAHRGAGAIRV